MKNRREERNGFTLTELVVAASLLVGVMTVVAPLTVRSGRMWQDTRHQQLAMDELSNQLERLTSLDPRGRAAALTQLAPSEFLTTALPSATIEAETARDEHGTRLVLSLDWNRPGARSRQTPSVTLVGWLDPLPSGAETGRDSK
jgi:prepilin-type N-terminal cleavage/methylation domain-containing protein